MTGPPGFVRRLLGQREPAGALPQPERPLYAIGDLHGRADLLDRLLERIAAHGRAQGWTDPDLVFLGDYVDRGPDSAGVIARLRALAGDAPERVVCLGGNHEAMFRDFLQGDEVAAIRFLRNGGAETLQSFGIDATEPYEGYGDLSALQEAARGTIPPPVAAWIAERPLWWRSGNVVAAHAALDPALPPEVQEEHVLIWGRGTAYAKPRPDGLWVVHGHTVTQPAAVFGRRVAVDTGAWFSDRLTAAVIAPGLPVRFLDTAAAS